jgi:hypothetical protein
VGNGDTLQSKQYPKLKQVIQISHMTLPGTCKFKNAMVYAQPSLTTNSLPSITDQTVFLQYFLEKQKVRQP